MESRRELAVLTPSYRKDAELCRELNRSVLRWMPENVKHHIVVPRQDGPVFRMLLNQRTVIHEASEFLAASIWKLPGLNMWVNGSRPWPPVRGWIAQQLIKLSAAANLEADAVLLVDSDMVMVAPTDLDSFRQDGNLEMYRNPGAVHSGLPRHRMWLESARGLLGLGPADPGDLTDYICWPCVWDPKIVRSMLQHVERVKGGSWQSAVASQLHFSEMMLYGTYVDEVLGGPPAATPRMKSINYSEEAPLTAAEIGTMLRSRPADALAVMISAKSGISQDVRSQALIDYEDYLAVSRSNSSGGAR
ncbi:DUF6492 family protein [Arthrobacter sp. MI7-26]|uniref:DUF6492 family protein n=1 Tax=Arthrobacter sp. MI7-26 TaxID=2993653 RepID=UPI002248FD84|nr:DUF6492 family protein [Arthrobacter sp. MI7-26]MCX2750274.1 DUF6492 family protein [Arthrobacter sp. MI7-26]